jgi:MSHA biogenesis protein MshM
MYYNHFGLSQAPFKITPNTEFFFSGGNRGPILEALIYAITHGEGIIKVTGEVGSGKTMLCHMLPRRLPPHVETVYIANPSVSPEEILHTIAFELQLAVDRGASRLEVMQALHDFLLKRYAEGKRVVVFVEESQSMPLATLEEIRLLSNLETKNDKLLQIVLFGQPELDDNLRQPHIRPLRERITHSFRLEPLAPGEIREYLMFRMRAAGYRGPDLFSGSVVGSIARASLGLTRRVNLIADKALLAAFSENTHTIRPKHVEAAVRDSEFSQQARRSVEPRSWWGAALVAGGAALGVATYALLQYAVERPPQAPRATQPATTAAAAHPAQAQVEARPATPPAPAVAAAKPAATLAAAAIGVRAQEPRPAAADVVKERMAATREWLASEAVTTYSIQLFGTNDPGQLRTHLNDLAKSIEMNKIFVYRTLAKQKPSLTVLYGSFGDRRAAQEALDRLPESLKVNQPILRTVNGIRTEIRQHEAS